MKAYVGEKRKIRRTVGGFKAGEIVEVLNILGKNKHHDRELFVRNIDGKKGNILYKDTRKLK